MNNSSAREKSIHDIRIELMNDFYDDVVSGAMLTPAQVALWGAIFRNIMWKTGIATVSISRLCHQTNLNRKTVQRGLKRLEDENLIKRVPGTGHKITRITFLYYGGLMPQVKSRTKRNRT